MEGVGWGTLPVVCFWGGVYPGNFTRYSTWVCGIMGAPCLIGETQEVIHGVLYKTRERGSRKASFGA